MRARIELGALLALVVLVTAWALPSLATEACSHHGTLDVIFSTC